MANSDNASPRLIHGSERSPSFHVVYETSDWIPPAKRLLMEQEADATCWWLLEHGYWQDSDITVRFPVNYSKEDVDSVIGYPILKRPDQPARHQPTKYYLGNDREIYALKGSTFIRFGTGEKPMVKDIDYIIEKLRLIRNG